MGSIKECLCGSRLFRIYEDVYTPSFFLRTFNSKMKNHLEIVCVECGRGVSIFHKYMFDNSIHFKEGFQKPIKDIFKNEFPKNHNKVVIKDIWNKCKICKIKFKGIFCPNCQYPKQ